jgi:hypothetical protein
MPMGKLYTITLKGGQISQGDCPKWAADFEGSPTQLEGGTIKSEPVKVIGRATRFCFYCQDTHVRIFE